MIVKCVTGMLESNCYIAGDGRKGIVIDPGAQAEDILRVLDETEMEAEYIILTHAHLDHIASVDGLRDKTGAQVLIHKLDAEYLTSSEMNGSKLFGLEKSFKAADRLLKHQDIIKCGSETYSILHTPGHTPGGICIRCENSVFTGDTLFRMSVGRTDLGNGSWTQLAKSIREILMELDDSMVVYPGHGPSTTIGYERKNNPYLRN